MTLTVRSATVTGATTKGSPLTHAELDENFNHLSQSSNHTFTPSGSGASARTVQAKLRERISVLDFGFATDGTTDNWAALKLADAEAAAQGKVLHFPAITGSKYVVIPTETYTVTADWEGDGAAETQLEVDTSTLGEDEVFLWTESRYVGGLDIKCKDNDKVGTGIQIKAASGFVSYPIFYRTWVRGFNKNVDVHQCFLLKTYHCRFESGVEGWYCAPTGYITTHLHEGTMFASNTRNIYYSPSTVSIGVTFVGCVNELAGGADEQAYFGNIRGLKFGGTFYCEGASTIPAVELSACRAEFEMLYLNGTGGITTGGSNVTLAIKGAYTTSATDVLTIAASANTVECNIENAVFPSSGNDISGVDRGFISNSSINGTQYDFYSIGGTGKVALKFPATAVDDSNANTLDDYEEGTFTPTIAGAAATGTNTYGTANGYYTKIGNRVFINGRVELTAKGTGGSAMSGNIYVGGLPFTAANVAGNRSAIALANWENIDLAAAGNVLTAYVESNTTRMFLVECTDNGAFANITDADISDTTELVFSGHYRV